MTLAGTYKDITRMALLGLAMLASMMGSALFIAQPAGLTNVSLSNGAETKAVFQLQADGYTWLPTLSSRGETTVVFQVQADGYTYLPTV